MNLQDNEKKYDAEIIANMTLLEGNKANVNMLIEGKGTHILTMICALIEALPKKTINPQKQEAIESAIARSLIKTMRKFKIFEKEESLVDFVQKYDEENPLVELMKNFLEEEKGHGGMN